MRCSVLFFGAKKSTQIPIRAQAKTWPEIPSGDLRPPALILERWVTI